MFLTSFVGINPFIESTQAQLPPINATIRGHVNDTLGNPLANASVSVYNVTHDWGNTTSTNATGDYVLGVFEGNFSISIELAAIAIIIILYKKKVF
jgi:hypothetical protein